MRLPNELIFQENGKFGCCRAHWAETFFGTLRSSPFGWYQTSHTNPISKAVIASETTVTDILEQTETLRPLESVEQDEDEPPN
jgi:hypothetical protein